MKGSSNLLLTFALYHVFVKISLLIVFSKKLLRDSRRGINFDSNSIYLLILLFYFHGEI